jgi:indole-3-glycerol phosphate synthase
VTTPAGARADVLETIVAATRRIVEVRAEREPLHEIERRAARRSTPPRSLRAALGRSDRVNVIAECKRRSPARGVLRPVYDPAALAAGYQAAGAAAISVLTEPTFFDGAIEHLEAVRTRVDLPLLRKDFVVSEYQLLEARAAGADAVLLIVAALAPRDLAALHARASSLGLDVLVEVHDVSELQAAVDAGARVIGVNNRNLRSLEVNLSASEDVMARMPRGVVAVSESGLRSADDLVRLRSIGYSGFLIGERFMAAEDPGAALRELLEHVRENLRHHAG